VLNGPLDAFYLRVKVALIVGIILSSPLWLYQLWAFIAPGLCAREKRRGTSSSARRLRIEAAYQFS
jgi:sec-independent protein translocase protein TatC